MLHSLYFPIMANRVTIGAGAAIGLASVVAIVVLLGQRGVDRSALQDLPAPATAISPVPVQGPNHPYLFFPNSAHVKSGVKYRFQLLTSCGLGFPTGPDFDGSFWDSVDAGQNQFGNPPAGFLVPYDDGYMVLLSTNAAEFHSFHGSTASFTRRVGSKVATLCE